jgi:hypothetical protein
MRRFPPAIRTLGAVLAAGAVVAAQAWGEEDPLDGRLTYWVMPGVSHIERSGATTTAGAAAPAGDGSYGTHSDGGYDLAVGAMIGVASWDHGLGVAAGAALGDSISRSTTHANGSGPGGTTVTGEDLDALQLLLQCGPTLRWRQLRFELMPDIALGIARGTLYVPSSASSQNNQNSLIALFGSSASEVRSGPGFYLGYGLQLAAYYAPPAPGELVLGLGVGYQAFAARVHYAANASTGAADDRLSGAGITLMAAIGGHF